MVLESASYMAESNISSELDVIDDCAVSDVEWNDLRLLSDTFRSRDSFDSLDNEFLVLEIRRLPNLSMSVLDLKFRLGGSSTVEIILGFRPS
jgi:hypothetical protein